MTTPFNIQPTQVEASNPFELVAYLFFKVRQSLEEPGPSGRPPRWVRIVRASEVKNEHIAVIIGEIVGGLGNGLSFIAELCLDIEEMLLQTDAGKALVEVSIDLLRAATDEQFIDGVKTLTGIDASGNPAAGIKHQVDSIKDKLKYIPEPEDIARLSHELYRLLCVEQLCLPRKDAGQIDEAGIRGEDLYVDLERSGKIRLMQWGYDKPLKVHGLGPKDDPESKYVELRRLGARWLWQTDASNLPKRTFAGWPAADPRFSLYELVYDTREPDETLRAKDLLEVHEILAALGYQDPSLSDGEKRQFTVKLARLLRQFQHINGLPKTGELDNPTLNRFLNMDFTAKCLARAKPFDPTKLNPIDVPDEHVVRGGYLDVVNPDADHPEAEGISIKTVPPTYEYYECGVTPPATLAQGRGWINHGDSEHILGFVALRSRRPVLGDGNKTANFDGDIRSEGEAASGKFFFCARFTEPWRAGRNGPPAVGALFGGSQPKPGQRSMMYQWLDIAHLLQAKPADSDLVLCASVLRRSLYTDRNAETGYPDRGSITLRVYGSDFYKGPNTCFQPSQAPLALKESELFPGREATTAAMTLPEVERSRIWVLQSTPELIVPAGAAAAMVSLEGVYQSGWDIDAYFDNVMVRWDYRKTA